MIRYNAHDSGQLKRELATLPGVILIIIGLGIDLFYFTIPDFLEIKYFLGSLACYMAGAGYIWLVLKKMNERKSA